MHVDLYCERTSPGLWAEPLNAASNIAFLLASAILITSLARQRPRPPASIWVLPALLGVVGLCSLSFHLLANQVTEVLDGASITMFTAATAAVVLQRTWNTSWRGVVLAGTLIVAAVASLYALLAVNDIEIPIVIRYVLGLVVLVALGLAVLLAESANLKRYGMWLLASAGILAMALIARSLDQPLCSKFPVGTHFLWHVLAACALWLVSLCVQRMWQDSRPA